MAPLVTLIAILITYLFPLTTKSQSSASCYYYGCGFYGQTQDCQCNRECEDFGDCCSDYNSICKHGNFEECPSAPIIKQDRRVNKNRLRFVSFNIEWLFLDYSYSMGGNFCPGNGCDWRNTPDAYKHMETVAEYLDQFDADIIMLQETCDCWTIQQLINIMPQNGEYYKPYLIRGADTATGQNVAMMTKIDPLDALYRTEARVSYPIPGSSCPSSSATGTQGVSKHFRSRFRIDGLSQDLTIFNFHFLAFPDDNVRCRRREGQATVIADMIRDEVLAGNLVMAVGDYNDFASSVCDINCNQPISSVEAIIRTAGNLINVAQGIPNVNERYASWWNCDGNCIVSSNCFSMIDHVLVSQDGLYNLIQSGTGTVRIDHGFENGCDTWYSDHWPYVIEFDLTQAKGFNLTRNHNRAMS